MNHTISQQPPTRRWHPTWYDVNTLSLLDDSLTDMLERRIIALEEALVSRRARRRLRREIRQADRFWRPAAPTFAARRLEITTYDWQNKPVPGDDR